MKLNKTQEQIVKTTKSHVLVHSAAASGKTRVLTERVRYLLNELKCPPSEIVVITFTNNAANEMFKRLEHPDGLFIGTVHSYCNYLLRGNAIDTSNILKEERFDDLFEEIKKNKECLKHITHLIVDEAQDCTNPQFEFFELINPDNYIYFYDIRQSIYGFADADPYYLISKEKEPDTFIYQMNQNYRNGYNILEFAQNLLYSLGEDYEDNSIAMREEDGYVYHTKWDYSKIADHMAEVDKYGDWFVLCRSNRELDLLGAMFTNRNIPYTTFKQADLSNDELEKRLAANCIKLLTIHSSKGLESKNVLVCVPPLFNDEEKRVKYVAATRAKDLLIWNKLPNRRKRGTRAKVPVIEEWVNWE